MGGVLEGASSMISQSPVMELLVCLIVNGAEAFCASGGGWKFELLLGSMVSYAGGSSCGSGSVPMLVSNFVLQARCGY